MQDGFVILVADRNRHVREFLQRELTAEGYLIRVAKDGRQVLTMSTEAAPPDLLILDLEIPYEGGEAILEKLTERAPLLPVVIHTFPSEFSMNGLLAGGRATVVEKSGNTDSLKNAVLEMLRKAYPDRFERLNKGKQMQSHGHI